CVNQLLVGQDAEIPLEFAGDWVVSKGLGKDQELVLVNLHTTERRSYLYTDGQWCRRYRWERLTNHELFDTVWLRPREIRLIHTLAVHDSRDALQFHISLPDGQATLHKLAGERELVTVTLSNGERHQFGQCRGEWYRIFRSEFAAYPEQQPPPESKP